MLNDSSLPSSALVCRFTSSTRCSTSLVASLASSTSCGGTAADQGNDTVLIKACSYNLHGHNHSIIIVTTEKASRRQAEGRFLMWSLKSAPNNGAACI